VKLTVVIPTMNKQPLLGRTLAALLEQDAGTDAWNVVVVDDGSSDGTAALLRTLANRTPRLRVVSPERNVGRAAARNLGWQAADGRWVLFLDDDILAPPGLLRTHLAVLESGEDRGTIGPDRKSVV
jgi:glycosyltransferase involved in cell wall biosynthesis